MENEINMTYAPVTDVLGGKLAVDSEVTVRGWIRSRRDSKAESLSLPFMTALVSTRFRPWFLIILIITKTKY